MENNKRIILIFSILLVFGILVVFIFDVNCLFKAITGIPCPGCGLTRGFRSLFQGNIIQAEKYNILTMPIFILVSTLGIMLIIDIIKKKNKTIEVLNSLSKHYKWIILIVMITWIINIINNI